MRKNNKALYEQIMRHISKQVKKALNEDYEDINMDDIQQIVDNIVAKRQQIMNQCTLPKDWFESCFECVVCIDDVNDSLDTFIGYSYKAPKNFAECLKIVKDSNIENKEYIEEDPNAEATFGLRMKIDHFFDYVDVLLRNKRKYVSLSEDASEYLISEYDSEPIHVNDFDETANVIHVEYDDEMTHVYINNIQLKYINTAINMIMDIMQDYVNYLNEYK